MLESAPPPTEVSPTASTAEEGSGESSEPGEDETDEAEPIPASSEGPAQNWPEPEIPEAIYEPTEEGAEALIQYWFDARHHARITGDVEVLEYVSLPDCELCAVQVERLQEVYPQGWYVEEVPSTVEEEYVRQEGEAIVSGLFALDESEFQSYWEGELQSGRSREQLDIFGLDFRFQDGRWQAFDFSHLGTSDEGIDADDVRQFEEGE
ncbi:hypothetical protein GCM10023354_06990 [Garicola koreensis]